jgi:hypothetical protein
VKSNYSRLRSEPVNTMVPLWSVAFNAAASLIGLVHIIYGTLVLSSVFFIRVEIAVYSIVRFILSALICRLILIVEFAGMRGGTTGDE